VKTNAADRPQQLGYGTGTAWYKTGDEAKLDEACIEATKLAIGLDYHHLDGAEVYKTETELGTAMQQSGVSREKFYLTTKVLPNIADIPAALKTSLKKLQTDYVDLYVKCVAFMSMFLVLSPQLSHSCALLQRFQTGAPGEMETDGGGQEPRPCEVYRR